MLPNDVIWAVIGFVLTLVIFSYLVGDNFVFRFVSYAFIGISAAYIALIIVTQVLWPHVFLAIINGSARTQYVGLVGLIFAVLLCGKLVPRLVKLGNIPMGFLVGVGAAVAIGGAVIGTIIPQTLISAEFSGLSIGNNSDLLSWSPIINGSLILIGTITTLLYFHYGARKNKNGKIQRGILIEGLAWIGKVFIAITLGSILAGVFSASLTALVERISFLLNVIRVLTR